jgi:CelD/BcsL family acetyltransferase involved in cellulose biosynthesis
MLRFHESAPREIAAWERPIHAKLARPPAASDVGRWRREMSRATLALFEAVAGQTLEAAGYAPHFRRSAPVQRRVVRAAVATAGGFRRAGLMPDWRGLAGRRAGTSGTEAARAGRPFTWRWEVGREDADFDRHAGAWNALAHSRSSSLFSDAAWSRAFAGAFLPGERVFLHVLAGDGRAAAVLPLRKAGGVLPAWTVLANHHTPGPPFAVDEGEPEVYGRILDHLLRSARAVDFGALPSGGAPCRRLIAAARERRLLCALKGASAEAVVDLGGGWARLRSALPSSLRKNAEAGARKLQALGPLAFEVVEGGRDLDRVLGECFHLETLGWKGRAGAPIKASPSALRFYTDLAYGAAAQSRLALYTLRLAGRLLAFEYCLRAQGRIALLKISYDPEFARHSPGHVLRCRILERRERTRRDRRLLDGAGVGLEGPLGHAHRAHDPPARVRAGAPEHGRLRRRTGAEDAARPQRPPARARAATARGARRAAPRAEGTLRR